MAELRGASVKGPARRSRAQDRRIGTDYLVFRLASEWHAIPVAHVREILKLPPLTKVPRAPRAVMGIVSVRGQIITVIDLRRKLHLAEAPASPKTRILLADGSSGETLGLWVDEVLEVHRFADTEIEHTSAALGNDVASHIAGIARPTRGDAPKQRVADAMIILLDVKVVLSDAT